MIRAGINQNYPHVKDASRLWPIAQADRLSQSHYYTIYFLNLSWSTQLTPELCVCLLVTLSQPLVPLQVWTPSRIAYTSVATRVASCQREPVTWWAWHWMLGLRGSLPSPSVPLPQGEPLFLLPQRCAWTYDGQVSMVTHRRHSFKRKCKASGSQDGGGYNHEHSLCQHPPGTGEVASTETSSMLAYQHTCVSDAGPFLPAYQREVQDTNGGRTISI